MESIRVRFTAFDASYLERLQRRDPATEKHFVAYFGELIRLKLRARLSSTDAIEDIRQETFVRVLSLVRSEQGIRVPEGLGSLVNTVCNYVLLEYYHAIDRGYEGIDTQPDDVLASPEISLPGAVELQEVALAVRKVLADMNERDRRLLELVVFEERDKDQVCAELGLTRDHLRVLLYRARQSFKAFYVKRFGTREIAE
jgi:RNA polymerase sigma-70 factor (ECF subfamily)